MRITATCRNCQQSFPLTWLIEGPVVTGECPWCETELTPGYVPLLPRSVRRADRGLALLLAGLGDLHSLSRGWSRLRVDPASIVDPIEEKVRSDLALGDGDGATHGDMSSLPPPMIGDASSSEPEWLRPTESEDDVARRRDGSPRCAAWSRNASRRAGAPADRDAGGGSGCERARRLSRTPSRWILAVWRCSNARASSVREVTPTFAKTWLRWLLRPFCG